MNDQKVAMVIWVITWTVLIITASRLFDSEVKDRLLLEERMLYKNWPEICKLAKTNGFLMIGLATLDLSSRTGREVANYLPLFFVEHEVKGVVPLSILKQEEMRVCNEERVYYISQEVALSLGIPTIALGTNANDGTTISGPIPEELQGEFESMKDTLEWKGQRFIVLMDQGFAGYMVLAPAELIDLDL